MRILKLPSLILMVMVSISPILGNPEVPVPPEETTTETTPEELRTCPFLELLNTTSCLVDRSADNVFCLDHTTDLCQCPEGSFCHHINAAKCVFVCMQDTRVKDKPEMNFNELSIKGPLKAYQMP